jgi:hypothetical protein
MKRRAVALAGLAVLLCAPGARAADPRVVTSVSPQPARFGDVIHATVTIRAATAAEVQPGFAPFQVLRSTFTHTRSGSDVVTTWRYDLQCLDPVCAPGPGARKVPISSSRVRVGGANVVARFQAVRIDPRTTAKQVANPDRYFLHPTAPVPPTYRFSPTTLRRAFLGASLMLVLVAAGLLLPLVRPRRLAAAGDGLDAVGRALALVRASLSRPPPDRRRALGLLSRTLRNRGEPQVARAAADLAWSEPEPDPSRMTQLVERIGGAS